MMTRRPARFELRLTHEEKALWEAESAAWGHTTAEWVRECVRGVILSQSYKDARAHIERELGRPAPSRARASEPSGDEDGA